MSKTRPINAVAELVWNSLDADADKIKVKLVENKMGGLQKLTVTDNGHGLEYALAEQAFGSLGGSWKKTATKTRGKKRFLHGRQGKGRFSAFALGQTVEWRSKFKTNGKSATFSVIGKVHSLGTFEIGDEDQMPSAKTGMEVVVQDFDHNFPSLLGDSAAQTLTEQFALYLAQYRGVSIEYSRETRSENEDSPLDEPKGFGLLMVPTKKRFLEFAQVLDKIIAENINQEFFAAQHLGLEEKTRTDAGSEFSFLVTLSHVCRWSGRMPRRMDRV
jgi:hypothetical protein